MLKTNKNAIPRIIKIGIHQKLNFLFEKKIIKVIKTQKINGPLEKTITYLPYVNKRRMKFLNLFSLQETNFIEQITDINIVKDENNPVSKGIPKLK